MKKLTLFLALSISLTALNAQQTCITATNLTTASSCNYSSHTTTGTDYWLKFTATSPTVNISLVTVKFDLNATHIHNLALYSGSCSNPILVADDELPFVEDAKELAIDLNASGLVVGQSYYLKATRLATHKTCDKGTCTANGSTNPTVFDICIQDIDVIIPLDFGLELPQLSHAYTTNRGQLVDLNGNLRPEIKLYNDRTSPAVYIADNKVSYVFSKRDTVNNQDTLQRIDVSLVGGNTTKVFKTEQIAGITNYYHPHIPLGITGNNSYSRAVCNEVYPYIDMQYYSNKDGLKYYFIVKPSGNANNIILKFDGATAINVTSNGGLEIVTSIGTLDFEPPHAYQVNNGNNIVPMPWQAKFIQLSANTVKFDIRNYAENMPLFIQVDRGHSLPTEKNIDNLLWSTYMGGNDHDFVNDIDNDDNGDLYFTGHTWSSNFPAITSTTTGTSFSARIIAGSHLPLGEPKWITIYGDKADLGYAIATDKFNNVYVTGITGVYSQPNQFPTQNQVGAYNKSPVTFAAQIDYAFLIKFNQNNGLRTWSTVFGDDASTASFWGKAIATDNVGNVYIGGIGDNKSNFPIVNGSGVAHIQTNTNVRSGFIAMFDAANNALQWSTMFGNNLTFIEEMNVNNNNELYITGETSGTNTALYPMATEFPQDYQQTFGGGNTDAFFAKFSVQNELKWSSFFGGNGDDLAYGIDYNEANQYLYITGETNSNTGFPLLSLSNPGVYNSSALSGGKDGFISVLGNPFHVNGNVLQYSTFYGGTSDDRCNRIDISDNGSAYIIGTTNSPDLNIQTLVNAYNQSILENDPTGIHRDVFIVAINNLLELKWSTFYGGERYTAGSNQGSVNSRDEGNGIAEYNDEILYIGGEARSDLDFPITVDLVQSPNAFIQYNNTGTSGQADGFLGQFDLLVAPVAIEQFEDNNGVNFGIYPNPTSGNLNLLLNNIKGTKQINIKIFDAQGKLIYYETIKNKDTMLTHKLELTSKSKGLYIIQLLIDEKQSSGRFIIH